MTRIETKINNVTVFPNKAQISRIGEIELAEGQRTVELIGLPWFFEQDSFQLDMSNAVQILDIKIRTDRLEKDNENTKEFYNKQVELTTQTEDLDDKLKLLHSENKLVDEIIKNLTSNEKNSLTFDLEQMQNILLFHRENHQRIDSELKFIEAEKKKLQEQQKDLEEEIKKAVGIVKHTKKAVVTLNIEKTQMIPITISYIISNASWHAEYDIRLDLNEKSISLQYNAIVKQSTEEDWENVILGFSNARVSVKGNQPDVYPWNITLTNVDKATRAEQMISEGLAMQNADNHRREMERLELEETLKETFGPAREQGIYMLIEAATKSTIQSGSTNEKVTLLIKKFPLDLRHSAFPRLSDNTYLKANILNSTDYPLLQGSTNVYIDNIFINKSRILHCNSKETLWTFLGVDDKVKISRRLVEKSANHGMFRQKTKMKYRYEIEITNTKNTAIEIVIFEQLPISNNKDLLVELIQPNQKKLEDNIIIKNDNLIEWLYKVEASKTVKFPLEFSLEYPNNMSVEGFE